MGKMQREKGKRFERIVAGLFREHGYSCRRSAQYCGQTGEAADVVGAPGLHIECKAQERMKLYEWFEQARRDSAGKGLLPVVIHKQNNRPVLVTMVWDDWVQLYSEWEAGQEWKE